MIVAISIDNYIITLYSQNYATLIPMFKKPRMLIIDDDELIRKLYSEIFTSEKSDVETASDGQEGLDLLVQGGYDVVLLDLMMPVMDGMTTLRELALIKPTRANKHILVLTNMDFQPTFEEAIALGAEGYLIKSAHTPDDVVRQVRSYL